MAVRALAPADIDVRAMAPADIAAVVDLQCRFLDGSTITELGHRFVTAFHTAALTHPDTIAYVAHLDGRLGGFIVASRAIDQFNAYVKPRVLLPLALALFSRRGPRIARDLVKGLFEREPQPPIAAELLLLVVDDRMRRRGIGQRLLTCLEEAFAAADVTKYRVAVRSHLSVAKSFYQATGFEVEQEMIVLGRPMTYLIKHISK